MTAANVIRWAVSAGWLIVALLLERIVTLGAITDLSEVSQNPPEFVGDRPRADRHRSRDRDPRRCRCAPMAILLDRGEWRSTSSSGIWLRQEEDDDSAAAIAS